MKNFRYLSGVATLILNRNDCVGCGLCAEVCPHGVLSLISKKAQIVDLDACMECGACAKNCPTNAVTVTPGVGCAEYIISAWIKGKEKASCGSDCC